MAVINHRKCFSVLTIFAGCVLILAVSGCDPKYPKCDKDDHCHEGEFCVNGMCQQCRGDADCQPGLRCNAGRCDPIAGYCKTAADCPEGQGCINNRCAPCQADGDCTAGSKCNAGKCLSPGTCQKDEDCPENHECQAGRCVAPPGQAGGPDGPCVLPAVYFDFDEFILTSDSTRQLNEVAACLKTVTGRKVVLEGHCDPRGTDQYNLALGDNRARSVLKHLVRLGVPESMLRSMSKGKLEAQGSSESGWARDRKVVFFWE